MDKKRIILMGCMSGVLQALATPITNVEALVNLELTPEVVARLPSRSQATPGDVFMGFTRGLIEGNYADCFYLFSNETRYELTGTNVIEAVSPSIQT